MISTTSIPRHSGSRGPASRGRRLAAATAVATLSLACLTGCQWTSEIQSDKWYTPSDGTMVELDDVDVRNLVILTTGADKPGLLAGSVISRSAEPVKIDVAIGQTKGNTITLPAQGMVVFGPENAPTAAMPGAPARATFTIPKVPSAPGTNVEVVLSTARSGAKPILVPVLLPQNEFGKFLLPGQSVPPYPTTPAPAHGAHGAAPAPTASPSH